MAMFMTRVELHAAYSSDYDKLHEAMKRQGFTTTITAGDGTVYALPTAEYHYVGQATQAQVLEKAKAAANSTGKSFGTIVTESNGSTWDGLPVVRRKVA